MTRAHLIVAEVLLPNLRLPAGFEVVWERDGDQARILTIDGPFPSEVSDGSEVSAVIGQDGHDLTLQWYVNGYQRVGAAALKLPKRFVG